MRRLTTFRRMRGKVVWHSPLVLSVRRNRMRRDEMCVSPFLFPMRRKRFSVSFSRVTDRNVMCHKVHFHFLLLFFCILDADYYNSV